MRILALIFFATTVPVFLFLTTILYAGISDSDIKEALATNNAYSRLSDVVQDFTIEDSTPETDQILSIVKERLTSSYLQGKTERAVDSSYQWITKSSDTAPTISFSEIKEDVIKKNPELLTFLDQQPTSQDSEQINKMQIEFNNFVKSDFTVNLDTYLGGVKNTYSLLRIIHPVIGLLLFASLAIIVFQNKMWDQRLKWLGATFGITGVIGFVLVGLSTITFNTLAAFALNTSHELVVVAGPIILSIASKFNDQYINLLASSSVGMFLLGAILFGATILFNRPQITTTKASKKKN